MPFFKDLPTPTHTHTITHIDLFGYHYELMISFKNFIFSNSWCFNSVFKTLYVLETLLLICEVADTFSQFDFASDVSCHAQVSTIFISFIASGSWKEFTCFHLVGLQNFPVRK